MGRPVTSQIWSSGPPIPSTPCCLAANCVPSCTSLSRLLTQTSSWLVPTCTSLSRLLSQASSCPLSPEGILLLAVLLILLFPLVNSFLAIVFQDGVTGILSHLVHNLILDYERRGLNRGHSGGLERLAIWTKRWRAFFFPLGCAVLESMSTRRGRRLEVALLLPLGHDLILEGSLEVLHPLLHQADLRGQVLSLQLREEVGSGAVGCLSVVGPEVCEGLIPPLVHPVEVPGELL